jgi:methylmalonyl-CoA mutase C-terminal domain/subunit
VGKAFSIERWNQGSLYNVKEATVAARNIRILVAKPGLDGHDRGAKVVAHALREAGMEVIYTGLHRTVDQIVTIALQEDVDVIGLSIMSGAHIPIAAKLVQKARAAGIGDKMVVVGGVIPGRDIPKLKELGVRGVFPGGTPFTEIVSVIKENVRRG